MTLALFPVPHSRLRSLNSHVACLAKVSKKGPASQEFKNSMYTSRYSCGLLPLGLMGKCKESWVTSETYLIIFFFSVNIYLQLREALFGYSKTMCLSRKWTWTGYHSKYSASEACLLFGETSVQSGAQLNTIKYIFSTFGGCQNGEA